METSPSVNDRQNNRQTRRKTLPSRAVRIHDMEYHSRLYGGLLVKDDR